MLNTLCRLVEWFELNGSPNQLYSSFLQGYSSLPSRGVSSRSGSMA